MDFGTILKRAWEIIWGNKILWLFGILVSCGSGGGGGSNFSFSSTANNDFGNFNGLPPNMQQFFINLERSIERMRPEDFIAISVGIIIFALIVGVVLFLLRTLGKVALIKGAHQAELGYSLNFGQLFNDIKPYYWRALGLSFVLGLAVFIVFFIGFAAFAILSVVTFGFALLCLIPLLCLLIPVAIGYGVYVEFVNNALVIEDLSVGEALRRGWQVLRANLGNVALMALILIIGGGLLTFLFTLPLFFVALPFFATLFFGSGEAVLGGIAASGILLLCAVPVIVLLTGILRSYISSAWTLSYLEISGTPELEVIAAPKKPAAPEAIAAPKKPAVPKKAVKAKAAPKAKAPAKKTAKKKSASPKPKKKS